MHEDRIGQPIWPIGTIGFRRVFPVPREALAMGEDIKNKNIRRWPPSLSNVRSEFEKLCDEFGGPADVGAKVDQPALALSCGQYHSGLIVPILLAYKDDKTVARRHWPLAAFAISQFVFETKELEKYTDEPSPKEIIQLPDQIAQSAHDLGSGLARLQTLSLRLPDPSAPLRRDHLAWLDSFISQAIAGHISNDVIEDAEKLLSIDASKMAFLTLLTEIEVAAKNARKSVDKTLLVRQRNQTDPALPNFVFRCGQIWTSLTARKPSANKVASGDPDFVVFLQQLAGVGPAPVPSRAKVSISIKNRTCD